MVSTHYPNPNKKHKQCTMHLNLTLICLYFCQSINQCVVVALCDTICMYANKSVRQTVSCCGKEKVCLFLKTSRSLYYFLREVADNKNAAFCTSICRSFRSCRDSDPRCAKHWNNSLLSWWKCIWCVHVLGKSMAYALPVWGFEKSHPILTSLNCSYSSCWF